MVSMTVVMVFFFILHYFLWLAIYLPLDWNIKLDNNDVRDYSL